MLPSPFIPLSSPTVSVGLFFKVYLLETLSVLVSSGYMLSSGIVESYDNYISSFFFF